MDSTNDAVIGVGINYSWFDLKNYAVSLDRCGFQGRKILFVHKITDASRKALLHLGFELVEYTPSKVVVVDRFKVLHDWLEKEQPSLRYVMLCDTRDVVFQSDPTAWFEKNAGTAKIFATSEFINFKNESCNPFWVEQLFGRKVLQQLQDEEVICAGTICGEVDAVKRLALRIYQCSTDRHGDDQAALNYLLRTEFKDEMRVPAPEDGFVLTVGWYLIGTTPEKLSQGDKAVGERSNLRSAPPTLRGGVAYPYKSDIPYCVVHQYERGNQWAPSITQRYVPDFSVSEPTQTQSDRFGHQIREGKPNNARARYAADGCTIDWWQTHTRV
jgi:hypothetical protein